MRAKFEIQVEEATIDFAVLEKYTVSVQHRQNDHHDHSLEIMTEKIVHLVFGEAYM